MSPSGSSARLSFPITNLFIVLHPRFQTFLTFWKTKTTIGFALSYILPCSIKLPTKKRRSNVERIKSIEYPRSAPTTFSSFNEFTTLVSARVKKMYWRETCANTYILPEDKMGSRRELGEHRWKILPSPWWNCKIQCQEDRWSKKEKFDETEFVESEISQCFTQAKGVVLGFGFRDKKSNISKIRLGECTIWLDGGEHVSPMGRTWNERSEGLGLVRASHHHSLSCWVDRCRVDVVFLIYCWINLHDVVVWLVWEIMFLAHHVWYLICYREGSLHHVRVLRDRLKPGQRKKKCIVRWWLV